MDEARKDMRYLMSYYSLCLEIIDPGFYDAGGDVQVLNHAYTETLFFYFGFDGHKQVNCRDPRGLKAFVLLDRQEYDLPTALAYIL